MTHFFFLIRIQKKYERLFLFFMRKFYAVWNQADDDTAFNNTEWPYGESAVLCFLMASPVYYRMMDLLHCFVGLTKAKLCLNDHPDDPYSKAIEPYMIEATMCRPVAFLKIVWLLLLYRKDHLKVKVRDYFRTKKYHQHISPSNSESTAELPF